MDDREREREREIGRQQEREYNNNQYQSSDSGSSFSNFVWAMAWILVTAIVIGGLYAIGKDTNDTTEMLSQPTDQKIKIDVTAPDPATDGN